MTLPEVDVSHLWDCPECGANPIDTGHIETVGEIKVLYSICHRCGYDTLGDAVDTIDKVSRRSW